MSRARVLLVEDEPLVREVVAATLRAEGYEVVEAANGAEALRVLAAHQPLAGPLRAVLLDMRLPEVDGAAILRQLVAQHTRVPVVAMSASADHLVMAHRLGVETVLPKPFELDTLLTVMRAYCSAEP